MLVRAHVPSTPAARRARYGIVLVGIGLIVASTAATFSFVEVLRGRRWVEHTVVVERELQELLVTALNVETGCRGYVLTGDPAYLEPLDVGVAEVDERLGLLTSLTDDNPRQRPRIERLRGLLAARVAVAQHAVAARRAGDVPTASALIASGHGKRLMDGIRAAIAEMNADEQRLLAARTELAGRATVLATGAGILVSLLLIVNGAQAVRVERRLRAERAAAERLEQIARIAQRVAHELNGPLGAAGTNVRFSRDLAAESVPDAEARGELVAALDDAHAAVIQASGAVRELQRAASAAPETVAPPPEG